MASILQGHAELPAGPKQSKFKQGMELSLAPFDYLSKNYKKFGDAFTLRIPASPPLVFFNTATAVKQVFAIPDHCIDQSRMPFPIDIGEKNTGFLGGQEHKDGRRILIPNVNTDRLRERAVDMYDIIANRVNRLEDGDELLMTRYIGDVTLDVACFSLTGLKSGPKKDHYKQLMQEWLELSTNNVMFTLGTLAGAERWRRYMHRLYQKKLAAGSYGREKRFYFTPWGRSVELKAQLDQLLRQDIRHARANKDEERKDILYYLSTATDSKGEPLSEDRLIAECLAVLFGGHETSAGTGGFWAIWLLKNPAVVKKIIDEVEGSIAEHGEFNALAVSQLPFLNSALMESQRLTPTSIAIMRCLTSEVEIDGYDLPGGVGVMVSPYLMGRIKAIWGDDAETYRPERWAERKGIKPYEFFPFGGGHRTCVGLNQARQQLKLLFAQLLLKTEWDSELKNNHTWPGQKNMAGTTQPGGGVPVTIRLKNKP